MYLLDDTYSKISRYIKKEMYPIGIFSVRNRTRTNTNSNETDADAAGIRVCECDARKPKSQMGLHREKEL
jgi:hypothetical protein